MPLFYRLFRAFVRFSLSFYYREVEIHGTENLPPSGPLLLLANHHIALTDPLLLIAASARPVRFLAKAPLFRMPVVSFFMRRLQCVPVYRQQDPGYAREKHDGVYDAVREALTGGGVIGLFPEGISHDDPALAELRHGAARMALDAESTRSFSLGLRIVLVGIHYDGTKLFRGRILVTVAPPFGLESLRESHTNDPRAATAELTARIREGLSRLILDVESDETVRLAGWVEKWGELERGPGLKGSFDRKKFILERYRQLRETRPREIEELRRLLRHYEQMIRLVGGREEIALRGPDWGKTFRHALGHTLWLAGGAPILLLGLAVNAIPFWLVRGIAITSAIGAERGQDVRATTGLLLAMFLFPIWYALLAILGLPFLPPLLGIPLLVAGAPAGGFALRWLERWRKMSGETATLWAALTTPSLPGRLQAVRTDALRQIENLRSA